MRTSFSYRFSFYCWCNETFSMLKCITTHVRPQKTVLYLVHPNFPFCKKHGKFFFPRKWKPQKMLPWNIKTYTASETIFSQEHAKWVSNSCLSIHVITLIFSIYLIKFLFFQRNHMWNLEFNKTWSDMNSKFSYRINSSQKFHLSNRPQIHPFRNTSILSLHSIKKRIFTIQFWLKKNLLFLRGRQVMTMISGWP